MRRAQLLSTLTPGRCFTLAEPPDDERDDADDAKKLSMQRSVLAADRVWKVGGADDQGDAIACEDAAGGTERFAPDTLVVEIPRQGFERLAERARESED